jgi:hypothetical protein
MVHPFHVFPVFLCTASKCGKNILLVLICTVLMDSHKENDAIAELSRAISFKADLHLLHLRAAFHEHIGDVPSALRDCRAALSLDPNHQEMLELQKRVNSQEP